VALAFPNNVRYKQKMKNGLNIWGYADLKNPNIISIKEYVKEGNDLDAYTVRFSDGQNVYQSADLAIL
jgi:hypothetical protein